MRKSLWRKHLTNEGEREFRKLDSSQKAQIVFKVTERAIQCLEDLTLILGNMHRISRNPDKQFRKILYKGDILPRFWKEFELAKQIAFQYKNMNLTPYSLSRLAAKLTLKGIDYDMKKLIEDKNYRLDKISELME